MRSLSFFLFEILSPRCGDGAHLGVVRKYKAFDHRGVEKCTSKLPRDQVIEILIADE